jgi:hypothetical protein
VSVTATLPDTGSPGAPVELPRIVSVDDHVVEPPHVWQNWLPEKYRDQGPKIVRKNIVSMTYRGGLRYDIVEGPEGDPCDCWVYEGGLFPHKRHVAAVGFDRDEMTLSSITYDEMRDGCYEPKARVADMSANWVDVSLSFPTFPRFCGQTFLEADDHDLAMACVKA